MPRSRQRDFERYVRNWLLQVGAQDLHTRPGGRHKRLYFQYRGRWHFYTLGTTVQDPNAHHEAVRTLKHKLGMRA